MSTSHTTGKGYTLRNLLRKEGNSMVGPMSPMFDKQAIDAEEGAMSNMMLRVLFDDPHMLQVNEGDGEWTGMDCLVLGWLPSGGGGYVALFAGTTNGQIMPIAMLLTDEGGKREKPIITPIYRKRVAGATDRTTNTYWKRNMPSDAMIASVLRDAIAVAPQYVVRPDEPTPPATPQTPTQPEQ